MIQIERFCFLWIWNKKKRRAWREAYRIPMHYGDRYIYKGAAGSDIIEQKLRSGKPCMVSRFGLTELLAIVEFLKQKKHRHIRFPEERSHNMRALSGFYPPTDENLTRFSSEALQILPDIDVFATWNFRSTVEGRIIETYNKIATLVDLDALGPNVFAPSWTRALAGKKVLVIHPFSTTIEAQYKKRALLFKNPDILPEFELKTLRAVQGLGGMDNANYPDWFAARDSMKHQIDKIDFDIAIIGCGAYGMFLAQYVKSLGKQAVHTAGATQLLFGIKGERWIHEHPEISKAFNENWTFPLPADTPKNLNDIMRGEDCRCYW